MSYPHFFEAYKVTYFLESNLHKKRLFVFPAFRMDKATAPVQSCQSFDALFERFLGHGKFSLEVSLLHQFRQVHSSDSFSNVFDTAMTFGDFPWENINTRLTLNFCSSNYFSHLLFFFLFFGRAEKKTFSRPPQKSCKVLEGRKSEAQTLFLKMQHLQGEDRI